MLTMQWSHHKRFWTQRWWTGSRTYHLDHLGFVLGLLVPLTLLQVRQSGGLKSSGLWSTAGWLCDCLGWVLLCLQANARRSAEKEVWQSGYSVLVCEWALRTTVYLVRVRIELIDLWVRLPFSRTRGPRLALRRPLLNHLDL
jgi:hypothetical protein